MKQQKYYWLKLHRDFFKRHDIQIIEDMPNGKDYILFYLKLLVESIDHEGNLRFSDTIPYNEDMLATITRTNVDIVRAAMKVFTELGMITIYADATIYMSEVAKMIGCETRWAEKKRHQRELPELVNGSVRINGEMLRLPDGSTRYVDEKRYGGNGMYVLDRAQGRCERCGSSENVVIHHLNGYSNDPEDLVCLCSKCHGIEHSGKMSTPCPPLVQQEIEKEIEIDKEKDKKSRAFIKPTVEEVRAYCQERNNGIDPERFVDFYEMKGWMIGKNKMKDWKAAVRTWEKRREGDQPNDRMGRISQADEEQRTREIDEQIRRNQSGESDGEDDGLWE